jgi:hypothetical protein
MVHVKHCTASPINDFEGFLHIFARVKTTTYAVKETTARQKWEDKKFGEYVCVRTRQSGDRTLTKKLNRNTKKYKCETESETLRKGLKLRDSCFSRVKSSCNLVEIKISKKNHRTDLSLSGNIQVCFYAGFAIIVHELVSFS